VGGPPYYRCACETGLQLSADGRSCALLTPAPSLLIFGQQKPGLIRGVDLNSSPGSLKEVTYRTGTLSKGSISVAGTGTYSLISSIQAFW
jgi:hypothetical protein